MNEKKKVGIFIGKFLPPHIGHISQIKKCLAECETLFVILADSKERTKKICKEAGIQVISAKRRLRWLKKCLSYDDRIKFLSIPQGMLEAYPDNIDAWKKKLSHALKVNPDVWFVDKNFLKISQEIFPEYDFIGFDRSKINISATEIRKTLKTNMKYIAKPVRKTFKKYLNKKHLKKLKIKTIKKKNNFKK